MPPKQECTMQQMPEYNAIMGLIPYGLPQFFDFELSCEAFAKLRRSFWEEKFTGPDGQNRSRLHIMRTDPETGDEVDADTGKSVADAYSVSAAKDLSAWYGKWLPLPFLRENSQTRKEDGTPYFESGPTNWARCRVVPSPDAPEERLRLVLAFDMQAEEPLDSSGKSSALSPENINAHDIFGLAYMPRDNAWFLNEGWVDAWLRDVWEGHFARKDVRLPRIFDECELVYLASYLVLLEVVNMAIRGMRVRTLNPEASHPIDVDLVLDIGNSRTTGMLVETRVQKISDSNDSYVLQLRDFDKPEFCYGEPFETRVEFSAADFGSEALSLRSGRRTPAFSVPSPVRTGPEAARLAGQSAGAEGTTGMSSPKRYLWDERDWQPTWRFHAREGGRECMVTSGTLPALLNDSGTPLCCMEDKRFTRNALLRRQERDTAFESKFTRSSMMMLLFVELLQQALMTINSPDRRLRSGMPDVPRRLRNVVFTVPSGMPVAERRIYRRWAEWAVKVLWRALGWQDFENRRGASASLSYRVPPEVICEWDEATCTQLVYVYNEIVHNFKNDAHLFFRMKGRQYEKYAGLPGLRVATVDMGGGTTDLSVTTFVLESGSASANQIVPRQELRDGFNSAGDDVLKALIRDVVFKALAEGLEVQGVPRAAQLLHELFGKNMINGSVKERNLRTQFVRQVAVPVALALLAQYEEKDLHTADGSVSFMLSGIFGEADEKGGGAHFCPPHPEVLAYVEKAALRDRGRECRVTDIAINIPYSAIDACIEASVREILRNMCELIHMYDCDVVLLTGRPSCWNAVVRTIFSFLPAAPSSIVPMRRYKVGSWYPFADTFGNIRDPKTTVVVGARLCVQAQNSLEGFAFDAARLTLSSTARYIGELDSVTGMLSRDKVWFTVDVDAREGREYKRHGEDAVTFLGPLFIGYRQLETDRWTTTRCYRMEFSSDEAAQRAVGKTPYAVDLTLHVGEMAEDDAENSSLAEGEFTIEDVRDKAGDAVNPRDLTVVLRTLKKEEDEGCWLDTGILY